MSEPLGPPQTAPAPAALPTASLWRRLAAMLYDALLLLALAMLVTACFLPFTDGEAVRASTHPVLTIVYDAVLVGIVVGFYGVFWTRQGHTLGMASWRLRVERDVVRDADADSAAGSADVHAQARVRTGAPAGALLTWPDTVRRLAAALLSWAALGLGWLWCLVDARGRTWHDILSHTRVVVLPKR